MDGLIYDFDLDCHEHLIIYRPGTPEEFYEWANVLEMSDKLGMVVPGNAIPTHQLPRANCAVHMPRS
jgi:hypothetical protein